MQLKKSNNRYKYYTVFHLERERPDKCHFQVIWLPRKALENEQTNKKFLTNRELSMIAGVKIHYKNTFSLVVITTS